MHKPHKWNISIQATLFLLESVRSYSHLEYRAMMWVFSILYTHRLGKVYGFRIIVVSNIQKTFLRPAQSAALAAAPAVTSRALRKQAKNLIGISKTISFSVHLSTQSPDYRSNLSRAYAPHQCVVCRLVFGRCIGDCLCSMFVQKSTRTLAFDCTAFVRPFAVQKTITVKENN